MRITIDIDEADLKMAMDLTGETKKGPAATRAILEFIRRGKINAFTRRVMEGEFDYPMTNDQLEAADLADLKRVHGLD